MKPIVDHRLTIITGHYGTGKSEFAVNLALHLSNCGEQVMLADLDIVNPYFRTRERQALFAEHSISLIASSQACTDADVPSLPPEVFTVLDHPTARGILDIGGDHIGARVLARFAPRIRQQDYQLIYVLNANRPEVSTIEGAIAYLRGIEATTGLRCSGIVNNTHLCGETTVEDVRQGAVLAEALSNETGIPVICHVANAALYPSMTDLKLFPIQIYMKKPWE